jgi:hypothetical protein
MIGDIDALTTLTDVSAGGFVAGGLNLFTPFQFWFCRNYGLALPLIALQYHEVRINLDYTPIQNLVVYTAGTNGVLPKFNNFQFGSSGFLVDYVYLDSEERRRFAQVGHEYLIEQLQWNENNLQSGSVNQTFILNFNHPCKEIIWAHRLGCFNGANGSTFLGYTATTEDPDWTAELTAIATRLVQSCIVNYGASAPAGASTTAVTLLITGSQLVTLGNAGATRINFNINPTNASGNPIAMIYNPLVSTTGGYNLLDKVQRASIDVTETGGGVMTFTVVGVNHTLTLADVSAPISLYTDKRMAGSTGGDVTLVQLNNYGTLLNGTGNIVTSGNIVLNGHDRFAIREGNYFNYVQPYQHHTRTPADGVNVYSFGLHPEQHQPTGTCNMSRIDSARLVYKVADPVVRNVAIDIYSGTNVYIYATNYNVLRIMSGMGGLAYSN